MKLDINQFIGKRYGRWTVLDAFQDPSRRNMTMFKVRCDCGNENTAIAHTYIHKKCYECFECSRKSIIQKRREALPKEGEKIGVWTIKRIFIGDKNKTFAECECQCGTIKTTQISNFKHSKTCINCRNSEMKGKPLERCRTGFGELSGTYWSAIQKGAESRGLEFTITIEECLELFYKQNQKCALSGADITIGYHKVHSKQTASLDRIDNNKGYITGNIQWLHKHINQMKHAHKQDYFIDLCKKVSSKCG